MLAKFSKLCAFRIARAVHVYTNKASICKVPENPVNVNSQKATRLSLSREEVALLERLSLVKFDTEAGVRVLEESITFAEQVLDVSVDNTEPMFTVLDQENLSLREDKIIEGDCQKDILRNASVTEEDYFVAPPGNIPMQDALQPRDQKYSNTLPTSK